jgi:hypothetical protein
MRGIAACLAVIGGIALLAAPARADDARSAEAPTQGEVLAASAPDAPAGGFVVAAQPCGSPCGQPCCAPCGQPCCSRFYVTVEGAYSILTDPEGPVGLDTGLPTQLRWDVLDYGGEFGVRAAAGWQASPCIRFEVRGAYLGGWSNSEMTGPGVYGYSIAPGGAVVASPLGATVLSSNADLWTAELNGYRRLVECGCWKVEGLAGARVVSFSEHAHAEPVGRVVGAAPAATFLDADSDTVFYGGQLGAMASWSCCPLTVRISGKALLGVTHRDSTVTDGGIFSLGVKSDDESKTGFAFGLEGELGLQWRVTRCVSIVGGYSVLFLDQVQRANRAMDFSNGNPVNGQVLAQDDTDSIVVQTVFLGVRLDF